MLAIVLGHASLATAREQEAQPTSQPHVVETSPFIESPFSTVIRNLDVRSSDLLEASLSVEDKGAKLTYAPLLYGLVNYRPVLSEMRLSIAQSNGLTTLGIGAMYDPASPRSAAGETAWGRNPPTSRPAAGYVFALRNEAAGLTKELKLKQQSVSDAIQRRDTKMRDVLLKEIAELRSRIDGLKSEETKAIAGDTDEASAQIAAFYRDLLQVRRPVISGAFTTTLFGILGGTSLDNNGNGLADAAHKVKARALSLTADLPLRTYFPRQEDPDTKAEIRRATWRWWQLSATITNEWQRGSQEETTPFATLFGFGIAGGGIVKILNPDFEKSQDYKDSFFIPSISAGASFERKRCTSASKAICPDSVETQTAVTPFVDIRVTKVAQFRFGMPLKFTHKVSGDDSRDLGVVAVYAVQLGMPK